MNNDGNPKETNQFWQPGSVALRYLDCTKLGKNRPPTIKDLSYVAVVMITAATFSKHSVPWVNNIEWHTIIADEDNVTFAVSTTNPWLPCATEIGMIFYRAANRVSSCQGHPLSQTLHTMLYA